jgi:hypothetical protein
LVGDKLAEMEEKYDLEAGTIGFTEEGEEAEAEGDLGLGEEAEGEEKGGGGEELI